MPQSPKLNVSATRSRYYQYYAGYSDGFVDDVLSTLGMADDEVILDPWNGAGTTTSGAARRGMDALGYDLNPVAVLVSRSQLVGPEVAASLRPLIEEVCELAERYRKERPRRNDLLQTWFGAATAHEFRSIERATYCLLVDHNTRHEDGFNPRLPQSPLAAAFYVLIFDVVRHLVKRYVPSNPAWIKNPTGRRLGIRKVDLHETLRQSADRLADNISASRRRPALTEGSGREAIVAVDVAASDALPLPTGSVGGILSSPPYCTRLDYVKATLPELAVLGYTDDDVRSLRDRMIGTPTMAGRGTYESVPDAWGPLTYDFIKKVREHSSYESKGYYQRYYLQYFSGMWASLTELRRVLKPGGTATLVVQDSYYKEVHLDLPALIGDMGKAAGWAGWERTDFKVPHTMANIHPGSRRYRDQIRTVESAITLAR